MVFSAAAAIAVFAVYRSDLLPRVKLALLLSLAFLGAPHSSPSDSLLLVLAVFFWFSSAPPKNLNAWAVPLLFWILPLFLPATLTKMGGLLPVVIVIFLGQIANALRNPATRSRLTQRSQGAANAFAG
jgi:hypothetical protein